ncbi:MAG: hypothetical protein ACRC6M_06565 [Microcystaceae cyanobacterium]
MIGASEKIQTRLQKLGLFAFTTTEHILTDRTEYLGHAIALVNNKPMANPSV